MKRHFVCFLSPGTFLSEQTVRPVSSWKVETAVQMAHTIVERYNARPYGFYFFTRERSSRDLDSKETAHSGTYFLGGKVETLEEIEARDLPEERILRDNMRCNDWSRIVVNTNSWRSTHPLRDGDTVLDVALAPMKELTKRSTPMIDDLLAGLITLAAMLAWGAVLALL